MRALGFGNAYYLITLFMRKFFSLCKNRVLGCEGVPFREVYSLPEVFLLCTFAPIITYIEIEKNNILRSSKKGI